MFGTRRRLRELERELEWEKGVRQELQRDVWELQGQFDLLLKHLNLQVVKLSGRELKPR